VSITQSGNANHDAVCLASEGTRQAADNAARVTFLAGGTSAAYQAALDANAAADFRRRIASCLATGLQATVFQEGLHRLTGSFS
jgi:hypothetical protein